MKRVAVAILDVFPSHGVKATLIGFMNEYSRGQEWCWPAYYKRRGACPGKENWKSGDKQCVCAWGERKLKILRPNFAASLLPPGWILIECLGDSNGNRI